MTKIEVDAVVKMVIEVCNQHLKPLKFDYNVFWITNSVRDYCRSGINSELRILRFLASVLWWNGHQTDGDCIKKLVDDIVSWKERGLIEEWKL